MAIKRFEEVEGWRAARKLTQEIYDITTQGQLAKDFGLRDQIQRAAVSTMANIAEGYDCGTDQEFLRFLRYAFRSATEVQSHLYVALDQMYITQKEFDELYERVRKTKRIIYGLMRYLRKQGGTK